jgi:hypothetical protein
MDFFNHIGKVVGFSIRFSSFLLCKNCKSLREFEEIEISRQICIEVILNSKQEIS